MNAQYVEFMCQFELGARVVVIAPLADLIHRVLCVKAIEFDPNRLELQGTIRSSLVMNSPVGTLRAQPRDRKL